MNDSTNFLIFSHEQDVDGLFSAAILRMVYPDSEVILTNYGFQNMLDVKNKILSFTQSHDSGTIIISDIGVNYESYLPVYEALSTSKLRGFSNIWIDHHVWPEGMREKFSPICEMMLCSEAEMERNGLKKSATELCIERFAPAKSYAKTRGCIAHRRLSRVSEVPVASFDWANFVLFGKKRTLSQALFGNFGECISGHIMEH